MASLRKAVDAGYRSAADFRRTRPFGTLRERDDFKKTIEELEKRPSAKPEKKP